MILEFLLSWWGLITVAALVGVYLVCDYESTKDKIVKLIFVAEERAREKALETGQEKFEWVVFHGYQYVPAWLRVFLSEDAFRKLVQDIFDGIVDWAEAQQVR